MFLGVFAEQAARRRVPLNVVLDEVATHALSTLEGPGFLTSAEQVTCEALQRAGFIVLRRGWPDFMAFHVATGQLVPVEVKAGDDVLSRDQQAMHALLGAAGLPVSVIRCEGRVDVSEIATRADWLTARLSAAVALSQPREIPLQHD